MVQKTSKWKKDHLSFSVRGKNIIFSGKTNAIFPDDRRKIMFQCNFFRKYHRFKTFEEYIIIPCIFWERSSFIFCLRIRSYLRGKQILSFVMIQERSYFSAIFRTFGGKNMVFRAVLIFYLEEKRFLWWRQLYHCDWMFVTWWHQYGKGNQNT